VLQELELEVYQKGVNSEKGRKSKKLPFYTMDEGLRKRYGKTLGCVALTRK
jgi:hypothetical protein